MKAALIKKNNKGAAILIALLVMLICVVVATIMVSAASSSLSRVTERSHQEQLYVAASSAAEIMADNYSGMKFVATKQGGKWSALENVKSNIAGNYIYTNALSLCSNPAYVPQVSDIDIAFNESRADNTNITSYYTGENNKLKLSATILMNSDFSITCVVTAKDSSTDEVFSCQFVVPASIQNNGESGKETQKVVTWGTAQMSKRES